MVGWLDGWMMTFKLAGPGTAHLTESPQWIGLDELALLDQ